MGSTIILTRRITKRITDKLNNLIETHYDINIGNRNKTVSDFTSGLINMCVAIKRCIEPFGMRVYSIVRSKITDNIDEKTQIDGIVIITSIKDNLGFVMLGTEIYFLFYHVYIVRFWIFLNLLSTLFVMYDTLSISDKHNRLITIGLDEIKKYSVSVIGFGIIIMIFFTKNIGILTIPVIIYLINRTLSNIFNRGF